MTHTVSVFLLGLVALFASRYFLPGDLIPWMGGLSGLMIFVMGIYLIFARWRQYKNPDPNLFENDHNHKHEHGTHSHTHDGVTHTHAVPRAGVPLMSLVALGISGAFQHVAGMKGAGRVIAINRDRHAPVFKAADWGFVGDLFDIVPELIQAARAERSR